jgi:peptide/nickel transport system substrate-binding protein
LPSSHVRYYVQAVQDVRVVDSHCVDLVTRRPAPVLLNRLVFVAIVPRDAGSEPIVAPVGTGPYRFVGGRPGGPIAGERFDRYWGARPAVPQVTVLSLPDSRERAEAVARGRADIVSQFPAQFWAEGRRQKNVELVSRQGLVGVLLGPSLRQGSPFADLRVRRAMAQAIDRDRLVRDAMQGLGAPLDQVVPPSVVGYASGLRPPAYDPDAARRLLREAGAASIDSPLYVNDLHEDVAREVSRQLQPVGIRLDVRVLPGKEFYDIWTSEELPRRSAPSAGRPRPGTPRAPSSRCCTRRPRATAPSIATDTAIPSWTA